MNNIKKQFTLLFFSIFSLASVSANALGPVAIDNDDKVISLKGKSVAEVYRELNSSNDSSSEISSRSTIPSLNPSYASGAVTADMRGKWFKADINTSRVPFGSKVTTITYSLGLTGGTTADRKKTFVYLCLNGRTHCKRVAGEGTGTTNAWKGASTWNGVPYHSSGWEYLIGVLKYSDESEYMSDHISLTGSVEMHWEK